MFRPSRDNFQLIDELLGSGTFMNAILKSSPPAFPLSTKYKSAVLDEAKLF